MLEWRKDPVELLECLVRDRIAKSVDEQLGVEYVLRGGTDHRSTSGGVISTPSIARVPSISSRWKTTRSSALSIVSVTVAAPSARLAALSFDNGNRYVRD